MTTIHLRRAEGNTARDTGSGKAALSLNGSALNRSRTPDPDGTECLYSTAKRFSSINQYVPTERTLAMRRGSRHG